MGIISLAVFGLIGLAGLAAFFHWLAWLTDPRFREDERRKKIEFEKNLKKYKEQKASPRKGN
jgi:hypothetical protein